MSQEAAKSTVSAQISDAEEPALLFQPLQAISLADVSKGTKANPVQPSQEGDVSCGKNEIEEVEALANFCIYF